MEKSIEHFYTLTVTWIEKNGILLDKLESRNREIDKEKNRLFKKKKLQISPQFFKGFKSSWK